MRWIASFAWLALAVGASADPVPVGQARTPQGLFEQVDEFFERNPELKTTRGSGWKPYNRFKWFFEQRLDPDGQLPAPGARWRAWERKQ